jgi:hypothetical protein
VSSERYVCDCGNEIPRAGTEDRVMGTIRPVTLRHTPFCCGAEMRIVRDDTQIDKQIVRRQETPDA